MVSIRSTCIFSYTKKPTKFSVSSSSQAEVVSDKHAARATVSAWLNPGKADPTRGGGGVIHRAESSDDAKAYKRQTFTLAKVFKDSKVGEAGVMLDLQQVRFVSFASSCFSLCKREVGEESGAVQPEGGLRRGRWRGRKAVRGGRGERGARAGLYRGGGGRGRGGCTRGEDSARGGGGYRVGGRGEREAGGGGRRGREGGRGAGSLSIRGARRIKKSHVEQNITIGSRK